MMSRRFTFAVFLCLSPAISAAEGVRIGGAVLGLPLENDFAAELPGTLIAAARLELEAASRLTFTPVAAESGNHNALTVAGLGTLTETRDFGFRRRGQNRIVGEFAPGVLDGLLIFSSDFGDVAVPGSESFGVFVDGAPGDSFTTFYLVYDDTKGTDGDFDDYVIRVDVEPIE